MYNKEIGEVEKELGTNIAKGLCASEVESARLKYGENKLESKKKQSIFIKFLLEFKDILIIILLIAAIVSLIVEPGEWVDSVIIFAVVLINAILGVIQENKAEKSLEALKKMSAPMCKVLRDGVVEQIDSATLVVGDIILIEAGDFVPADARIIECSNLQVDESALTGESVAVVKHSDVITGDDIPLGDRKNSLYSSTFVTNGRAKAIVTAIGMNTEIGRIAGMLMTTDNTKTPLQGKLDQVGKVIGVISIIICAVVFGLEMLAGLSALSAFKTAIALAVAAIPEGLATVVTIVLAIGVEKMAKEKSIVKKLPAVETLGSTSIVCSDKTGTLTQNKMTVVELFSDGIKKLDGISDSDKKLLQYFALCCDAKIEVVNGEEKRIGDPTETALIDVNNKYGISIADIQRVADIPFDSDRKLMTVVVKLGDKYVSITKGAPDIIVKNSINGANLNNALQANTNMAERALRVLGLGIRVFDEMPQSVDYDIENNLEFLGLVGMIDPARPEVKDAIAIAKKAGIRTIMITGDHITTATAIARELGIISGNQRAITSDELSKMSDEELFKNIELYSVYARVAPKDKVRIVEAWQKKGMIVSMTGDGVNDSPALKKADIGCAMGITGTDVSKEAADMILVDDNFATIIKAVKQGRGIYSNVKKCVKYLLSSNIGEVFTIFISSIIAAVSTWKIGVPLLPIHLLWINLITDSLPAFGLGMEAPEDDVMLDAPRAKNESFFADNLGWHIAIEGVIIGALTLSSFLIGLVMSDNTTIAQTMAFFTLSTLQLFHAFNVKSEKSVLHKSTFNNKFLIMSFVVGFLLQIGIMYIPGINTIFKLCALSANYFFIALGFAFSIVIVMEVYKLIVRIIKK